MAHPSINKGFLLHGSLEFVVKEAKNLPKIDMIHRKLGSMASKIPGRVGRKVQHHVSHYPYVTVSVSGAVIGRTFVINNSENPVWMQHFNVLVAHYAEQVHFVVKNNDVVDSKVVGEVRIPVVQLCSGATKVEGSYPILNGIGAPCNAGAVLSLSIQYTPLDKVTLCQEVSGTYFPVRRGNKVTLYQDAHVHDDFLPNLKLEGGVEYKHGNCWHDIFEAISEARHLIYISGWSLYHEVRLVRDDKNATDSTLGELLKTKSRRGVRVVLLVWDDPTSLGFWDGIMHTNDEQTRNFFKHSSVNVKLCIRSAGSQHSLAKQGAEKLYSHHQKTVIVDVDADADAGDHNKRKIIAFIGGLDLCMGRYDTPKHPLFRTLQTEHKDDYHNPSFKEPATGCPRQPWHDLHCQIDGPAVYDILNNFEKRWLKASIPHGIRKLQPSSKYEDVLLEINKIPEIIGTDVPCVSQDDPEAWNVQVFSSIDSNSVKGFPEEDPKHATRHNLVCGKNVLIDTSIHTAYVTAIRAAQNFIYIENQYFLGSSYNWDSHKDLGASHLIPMEIALKIVNKIKVNERFSAYIVIPMWPEGDPTERIPNQRILYWQHKTMEMMYEMIYEALKENGLENKYEPQDYLNFFCLGNREAPDREEDNPDARNSTAEKTPQALTQESRRFMIYVHSKGMIVDDEYVILGSANINQRSMEGTRDTEIAMGAYQPHHTCRASNKLSTPHGRVYGYRMSLWAEHIGALEECFKQPESLECVRRVRSLSEHNWRQYAADEVTEMKGHLLKYPLEVDQLGKVKPLPGCESFPDVGGNVTGKFSFIQETLSLFHLGPNLTKKYSFVQENLTI